MKVYIGTAGIPANCKQCSSVDGVKAVSKLGLNAMEVEFVRGVRMSLELAQEVGKAAKKYNIKLSVHAPYYINLCSSEKEKIKASKKRIIKSCERASKMEAGIVVFHPAYYGKSTPKQIFKNLKKELQDIKDSLKKKKINNVYLGLETTGKQSQFGTLDETIQMCKELNFCKLVIDFAHLFARNGGNVDFSKIFDKLKPLKLNHIHCHFSGIDYSVIENGKGNEKRHLPIEESKIDYQKLAKEIIKRKLNITLICESPVLEIDALKMKKHINLL